LKKKSERNYRILLRNGRRKRSGRRKIIKGRGWPDWNGKGNR
jgi:hypothetical protein